MLGFLSTFIPASAQSGRGAGPDGGAHKIDPRADERGWKSKGNESFHSTFAKGGQPRPEGAGGSKAPATDESLSRGESDPAEQPEIEAETGDLEELPSYGDDGEAFDTPPEAQPSAEEDQADAAVFAPVEMRRPEPGFPSTLQGVPNDAVMSLDSDGRSDGAIAKDAAPSMLANLDNVAGTGLAYSGAYRPAVAGSTVDSLRAQSALPPGLAAGQPGAPSLHVSGVPIQEAMYQHDQTALSEAADLAPDGQTILPGTTAAGGAIRGLAPEWAPPKDMPLSGRHSATNVFDVRAGTASDVMRNAVSEPLGSLPTTFAADLSEGVEAGKSIVTLIEAAVSGDPRPSPATTTELRMSTVAGANTPQMARHVAVQLSEAAGKAADGAINLTLNPVELGRVRIILSPGDGGMVVSVSAERPETLDMMRRHIDVLDQEFRDLGYGATDFTFSKEESETRHAEAEKSADRSRSDDDLNSGIEHSASRSASVVITDRLDIRL
ncbi:MAG TPA: flagellar hook-length control protein FliK [Roseovarius sp.]